MEPPEMLHVKSGTNTPRRSSRVATDVLIEVQGEDFAYAGETVTVNLHGALIRTSASLELGTPVVLFVHRTGKSARAHVVFASHEANTRYGIEFDQPDNIWGISGIPADWTLTS